MSSQAAFAADVTPRVLPTPDLSKLAPARADELRKARASLEQAKTTLVGDPLAETYALLGLAYARSGFYDVASVALDNASQLAPHDARWWYAHGLVARAQERTNDADRFFNRAFEIDKQFVPMRVAVAAGLIDKGDLDGARKVLADAGPDAPSQGLLHSMLADVAIRQKRYSDAVEETQLALKADPQATRLYAQLADAYTGAGDKKAAEAARAKAGSANPSLADPIGLLMASRPNLPVAAPGKAGASVQVTDLVAAGRYDAARHLLDEGLQRTPNDAGLLSLYSRVDVASGNLAQAKQHAAAAIAADPKSGIAYLGQGVVLEASHDDEGALHAYEKAISLDAALVEPRLRLGNLYMRAARFDLAATQYRNLTQSSAGEAVTGEGWTRFVAAESADGKCAGALKEINTALARDSANDGLLLLFVRLASTCPVADGQERKMALDYGAKLYRQNASSSAIGEGYALSLAANGKWDDAVSTQEAAMFVLVRNRRTDDVAAYREFLQQFRSHKLPDRPWPASSALFNPPRAAAVSAQAPSTPAAAKK